ncbi:MAG: nucleotide sugar dehydrogenase [Proteobacteria bacterium]|nr:nucleotide sugar dehydrogenase [Pseudomonadota bacterium]
MTNEKICVVGLGYVGLPLALAFAKQHPTLGVDNNPQRLATLQQGIDSTSETSCEQLRASSLRYAANVSAAGDCNVYIVTAPTPVYEDYRPNWSLLEQATRDVAAVLKKGDLVVFESTVCPGSTDYLCTPILEKIAGLQVNVDFSCAYSPERISPNEKGIRDAVKIISASNPQALKRLQALYEPIIPAGLHIAESIQIAEAAKLTENIQRDVDIAITNELAMIFDQFGIDSDAVFAAAATKWNFRRFRPGLVGGHCIGTDSYYLLERTDKENLPAPVLRAARQANNAVPSYIAERICTLLQQRQQTIKGTSLLLLGYAFKENCADVRHTLVEPLRSALVQHGFDVSVCDPVADAQLAQQHYGVTLLTDTEAALKQQPQVIVFAVAHQCFANISETTLGNAFVADIKRIAARADWRL